MVMAGPVLRREDCRRAVPDSTMQDAVAEAVGEEDFAEGGADHTQRMPKSASAQTACSRLDPCAEIGPVTRICAVVQGARSSTKPPLARRS